MAAARPARPAAVILDGGPDDMVTVIAPDENGLIRWIYIMRNPDKLPATRQMH